VSRARLLTIYELLVGRADAAFQEMVKEHGTRVPCERRCSDCCHAVFGLFLFEAAYLKDHFDQLREEEKEAALQRCSKAESDLRELETKLQAHDGDPNAQAQVMATSRVRCPLLNDEEECTVYSRRPITCRVYGIPTQIHGRSRVCGKADFKEGESYPIFDLDKVYYDLFMLSRELLNGVEGGDPEKASLLISVPKAIRTPLDELIK
jgi:Fe-S-cluster containining protein